MGVALVMASDTVLFLACLARALRWLTPGSVLVWVVPWMSWHRLALLYLLGTWPTQCLVAGLVTSLTLEAELLVPEWPLRRIAATTGRRLMLVRCLTVLLLLPAPLAFEQYQQQVTAAAEEGVRWEMEHYAYSAAARRHLHGLQNALSCCGTASLDDWFTVAQVAEHHAWLWRMGSAGTLPPTDEVPLSCCRRHLLRECSVRGLRQEFAHLMHHERPTVHTLGCVTRLSRAAEEELRSGWLVVMWGLLQLPGLCLPLRLITTAMHAAAWRAHRLRHGDLTVPAAGWLVTDRSIESGTRARQG